MLISTVIALLVLQHLNAVSLPTLPKRFTAIVEANIINKNTTWIMEEWYDFPASRAKRIFYYDKLIMVFYEDFANHKDQLWSYTTSHNDTSNAISCKLESYNNANQFPLSDETSSGRLASSSQWFQFGGNFSEEYLGNSFTIRGISAEAWTRNSTLNFTSPRTGFIHHQSFDVTYYFSVVTWNWFGSTETRIPLRVELTGQRITDYGGGNLSIPYDYYHIYEYVQFLENDLTLDEELVFDIPDFYEQCNITSYCDYYVDEKAICTQYKGPAMPRMPKGLSMRVELNTQTNNNVGGVPGSSTAAGEYYYDLVNDRSHMILRGLFEGFYENAFHELTLAEHNQRWIWLGDGIGNTATSEDDVLSYCEMQQMPFNITSPDYLVPVSGGHILNLNRLFLFNDDTENPYLSTEIWMGYTTVRNIPAEKWKATLNQALTTGSKSYLHHTIPSVIPHNQMIIVDAEIYNYFSSANWTFSYMQNESVVLLRGEIFGTYTVYNFSESTQNYDIFVHEYSLDQSYDIYDYLQQTPSDEYFTIPLAWRRECIIDSEYCIDTEHEDHVDEHICDADLSLPSLPEHKYYALIEANDLTRQETYIIETWYNFDLNEMRNEVIFGRYKMVFYDSLDTDRRWSWRYEINNTENIESCTLTSYSSSITDDKFAETASNGHIKSVTDLWQFGAAYNETYLGNGFNVRGINARSWHSALNTTFVVNDSYTVRVTGDQIYYFADDVNWNYYDNIESANIPLRVFMDLNVDRNVPVSNVGDFPSVSAGAFQLDFDIISFLSGSEAFSEDEMSFIFEDWYAQCDTSAYCDEINDNDDICVASRGPKMPTLPFKFYVLMEGSTIFHDNDGVNNWNGTFVFEEYYDYIGNRAHAVIHNGADWMDDSYHQLDLLDKAQKWTWSGEEDSLRDCDMVQTQSNFSGIDLMITESNGHLATPSRLFRWNDSTTGSAPPVWHGYTKVRGVTAEKWMSTWSEWNEIEDSIWSDAYGIQFDAVVTYYWTTEDWNTVASQWEVIPLRMEMTGVTTMYNYSEVDGEYNIFWMTDSFTSVFDIIVFNGEVEDDMFTPPLNWRKTCEISEQYCASFSQSEECFAGPSLPTWPDAFSTTIQGSFVNKNYTMTMEEYYDWNGNRERVIIHPYNDPLYGVKEKFINPDNPAVVNNYLEDGNVFWHWNADECLLERTKQLDNATKSPINSYFFAGDGMDHKDEHISTTVLTFEWFGDAGGEFYQGKENVRGMVCDRWDSLLNMTALFGVTEMKISYYFMSADVNLMYPEYSIPVQAHIVGTTRLWNGYTYSFENYYDFFNFKPGKPEEKWFEPPFDDDERRCDFSLFCAEDNDLDENRNYSHIIRLCDDIDANGFVEISDLLSTKVDCEEEDSSGIIALLVILLILLFFVGLFIGAYAYRWKIERDRVKFEQMNDTGDHDANL